ncbi:transcriptional regulator [Halostagnicola sp. A-GB9-2]|uniref:helix-turn-helix transcriptional regulator n=1 Tax=Halostagnicola sp. A-GB9-2 TaxID=3048066 RepID=UPI0024BF2EB2|nr:transcriptional regulator [Halostagnicola sp. A-GB9-2]MDJ1430557.1 transcriptional regulator [Halostagnicola sp. A-GB9-2]
MAKALEDVEFLVSSSHRVGVLNALMEHPRDRNELRETTGASSPTMGRILSDFETRRWIEREGHTYRLTGSGEFVADRLAEFLEAMALERRLRDISPWLPYELDGFCVDLLTDAVVSYPGPGYPYEPLERNEHLLEETETIRGFGMVLLKASVLEDFFDRVFDGLEVEMIYPPHVFEAILNWNSEVVCEAVELDTHTVYLHDDLPSSEWCGICLSDTRLSICCYEPDTGTLRSLVDTDTARAYEWGESIIERYRTEAQPLDDAEDLRSVDLPPSSPNSESKSR